MDITILHYNHCNPFFRAFSQLLKLRFTAMVTYSFHLLCSQYKYPASRGFILSLLFASLFMAIFTATVFFPGDNPGKENSSSKGGFIIYVEGGGGGAMMISRRGHNFFPVRF